MLRTTLLISAFALFLCAGVCAAVEPGALPGKIFREARVGSGAAIVLGDKFIPGRIAVRVDSNTFELRNRSFSGAKTIRVTVSDMDIVKSLTFVYDSSVTYPQVVASYQKILGEPSGNLTNEGDEGVFWTDEITRFEVIKPRADSNEAISRLIDRGPS